MSASLPVRKKAANAGSGTTITATWDGGATSTLGNKLIAFHQWSGTTFPSAPTGWTVLRQFTSANSFTVSVFAKVSAGTETGVTVNSALSGTHELHLYEAAGLRDTVTHLATYAETTLSTGGLSAVTMNTTGTYGRKSALAIAFWGVTGSNMGTTTMSNSFSLTDGLNNSAVRGVSGVKVLSGTVTAQNTVVDWADANTRIGQGIIVIFDEEPLTSGGITASVTDNFNDNTVNTTLWESAYSGGGAYTEVNGRARVTPGLFFGAGYLTYNLYTLTNNSIHVEVPKHPTWTGGDGTTVVDTRFALTTSEGTQWRTEKRGTNLRFVETINGSEDVTTITFDASAHRWWKISELSNTMTWQTSPDGLTWTTRRTKTPGAQVKPVSVGLIAVYNGTGPTFTASAEYDNVNITANPAISTVTDNFDDSSVNTSTWGSNFGTVNETGGRGRVSTLATASYYMTDEFYNLYNSEVRIEVPTVPDVGAGTTEAFLSVHKDNSNYLMIVKRGTNLIARRNVANSISETSVTYNSTTMRFWRIRESSDVTYFEYSSTGTGSWTEITNLATPIEVSTTQIRFGSQYTGAESGLSPAYAEFDNLNLDPPASSPQTITTPTGISTDEAYGSFTVSRAGVTIQTIGGVLNTATFGSPTVTLGSAPDAPGVPGYKLIGGVWTPVNIWIRSSGAWVSGKCFVRKNGVWVGQGPSESGALAGYPSDSLYPEDNLFPEG